MYKKSEGWRKREKVRLKLTKLPKMENIYKSELKKRDSQDIFNFQTTFDRIL